MQTETRPTLNDIKANAAKEAQEACDYLLKTFSFVPDDKLNWSPAESARTALQLVVHCGLSNKAFASIMRGEDIPMPADMSDFRGLLRGMEAQITDRTAAIELAKESTKTIIEAISEVTEETFATSPSSPFGPMPMPFWMTLAGMHMKAHACQMDYLQTIYGDVEDHF